MVLIGPVHQRRHGATRFTGYEGRGTTGEGAVQAILVDGARVQHASAGALIHLVFDQTPLYARTAASRDARTGDHCTETIRKMKLGLGRIGGRVQSMNAAMDAPLPGAATTFTTWLQLRSWVAEAGFDSLNDADPAPATFVT